MWSAISIVQELNSGRVSISNDGKFYTTDFFSSEVSDHRIISSKIFHCLLTLEKISSEKSGQNKQSYLWIYYLYRQARWTLLRKNITIKLIVLNEVIAIFSLAKKRENETYKAGYFSYEKKLLEQYDHDLKAWTAIDW